jgi:hypothetical protein
MASLHIDATRAARAADPEGSLADGREYGIPMGFAEEGPALARVLEKLHRVGVFVGSGSRRHRGEARQGDGGRESGQ